MGTYRDSGGAGGSGVVFHDACAGAGGIQADQGRRQGGERQEIQDRPGGVVYQAEAWIHQPYAVCL